MKRKTLKDLFVDELKDMLDAEQRLTKALPKLAKSAHSELLTTAFNDHLEETKTHVQRLETVLESVTGSATSKPCKAMQGLLAEGEELMEEEGAPFVHDSALIAAAQKVEHYEIATYGCLRAWAQKLGENEAFELLTKTIKEEAVADRKLTEIADSFDLDSFENGDDVLEMSGKRSTASMAQKSPAPKHRKN